MSWSRSAGITSWATGQKRSMRRSMFHDQQHWMDRWRDWKQWRISSQVCERGSEVERPRKRMLHGGCPVNSQPAAPSWRVPNLISTEAETKGKGKGNGEGKREKGKRNDAVNHNCCCPQGPVVPPMRGRRHLV